MSNSISTKKIKQLLFSHNLFLAGRILFEIFLSVFIWKETQSVQAVVYFNLAYLLMHTTTFVLSSYIVKKGFVTLIRNCGLLGFGLVYLFLYILGENASHYIVPIGAGIGFSSGLYWLSYQVMRFDLTHLKNRGNYTGMERGLKIGIGIIMPTLGGFLISLNFLSWGYATIFLFGALLFLIAFFVGKTYHAYKGQKLHMQETFKILLKDKDIMKSMGGYSLGGFCRAGALTRVLLPLVLFNFVQNEFELGGWLSFFAFSAMIFSIAFGRYVDYKRYKKSLTIGGSLFALFILGLIFYPTFAMYILFGVAADIIVTLIGIPKRVYAENLIHNITDYESHRVEYIAIREIFNIIFGRIPSYILLLFVSGLAAEQLKYILLIFFIVAIVETFVLRSINIDYTRS